MNIYLKDYVFFPLTLPSLVTQWVFTFSKSSIKTLEKDVKFFFFLYKWVLHGLTKNTVTNYLHPGNREKNNTKINNKKWKIE